MRTITAVFIVFSLVGAATGEDLIDDEQRLLEVVRTAVHEAVGDVESGEISVEMEQGAVTLSGELNRLSHVIAARNAAAKIPGVIEIDLEVDVATAIFDDDMIEDGILRAFQTRHGLTGDRIEVDSTDGEATLSGEVKRGALKLLAEKLATDVDGVVSITNEITTRDKSDKKIRAALKGALNEADHHGFADVHFKVHGGYVSLSGTVPLLIHAYNAENAARSVDGVAEVDADLEVVPPTSR